MPILTGPLRGRRWVAGSGTHGCWLGTYEVDKARVMLRLLRPGDVFFDIGAHAGYFTLLASSLVGPSGVVVAFEPLPQNLIALRRQLQVNHLTNVRVIAAAVSDAAGTARFDLAAGTQFGHLSASGALEVRTVRLDDLTSSGALPMPRCLKIDVEGAEVAVLRGAERMMRASRPTIFLSTHGRPNQHACRALLEEWDYRVQPIGAGTLETASELLASPVEARAQ